MKILKWSEKLNPLHFFTLNLYKKQNLSKNTLMKKSIFLYLLAGFIAGIISGFFGAGGGMILVPFMTLIMKNEEVESRATTILCIFFMVLTSSFFYYKENSVDWIIALKCAVGGIIGGVIGSKLLINLDKKVLKIFFILLLIYSGVKMVIWQ